MIQRRTKRFKSLLPVLLAVAMFLAVLPWEMAYAETDWLGDGTKESPYIITTADQLAFLAERVNDGDTNFNDKYYKLGNNIDLSEYNADNREFNDGKGWIPIGERVNTFQGHFDGDGKEISGLYINNNGLDYMGLFGVVDGGCVKNLGIVDANITGRDNVGGVAGMIYTIRSRSSSLEVMSEEIPAPLTATPMPVPTVSPNIEYYENITNCYVTGIIEGNNHIGGIVGTTEYGTVNICYTKASVYGVNDVGGVIGYIGAHSGTSNCYSNSDVYSKGSNAGGVVGLLRNGVGIVSRCYATGAVNGVNNVGGIAGNTK